MELDTSIEFMQRRFRVALGVFFVLLTLTITPWTPDPAGDIKRLILSVGAAGLALAWLTASWRLGVPARRPRLFLELLLGLLLFYAASTLLSPYPMWSIGELVFFLALFGVYFVASQVYTHESQVHALFLFVCGAMAAASAYAFCQKAGFDPFPWTDREEDVYTNLPGTFGNPNYAAHMLVPAMFLAGCLALRRATAWCAGFLGVFALYQYWTEQRGGLIAIAAAIVLLLCAGLARRVIKGATRRAVVTLVLVAALGMAGIGAYMLQNRLRNGTALPLDGSLLIRYNGYLNAAAMVLDHPLLGHGPGVFALSTPAYWTAFEQQWFAQEQRMNAHVHNDLFEVAVDAGLPAAGLYLAVLVVGVCFGLLMAWRATGADRRRLGLTFAACLFAFLVDGLFGFNLRVPVSATLLFLLLGVMEGLYGREAAAHPEGLSSGRLGKAWRVGMAGLAIACAVWGALVFSSQFLLQQGLRYHMRAIKVVNASPQERKGVDPKEATAFVKSETQKARQLLEAGERLAPWNHLLAGRLGELAMAVGDYAAAVTQLERALRLNPEYVPTLARMANAKLALAEAALADAAAAQTPPPESAIKLLDEADRYASRAQELCAPFPTAEDLKGRIACARATCLSRLQPPAAASEIRTRWAEGAEHFERAIQLGARNHIDLYRLLARAREEQGDEAGKEEALVRAAQANPADELMWAGFFDFALRSACSDRVRSTVNLLISHIGQLEPPRPDALSNAYLVLAKCYSEQGNLNAADLAYMDSVKYGADQATVWTAFAQYANKNARIGLYRAELAKAADAAEAAEVLTQHALAVGCLLEGEILEAAPNLDGAEAAYTRALRFGPDRPDVWANFANFARKNGRLDTFKEALRASCKRSLEYGPTPLAYVLAVSNVLEQGPTALDAATDALLKQYREYPGDRKRLLTIHLGWVTQLFVEAMAAAQQSGAAPCMANLNLAIVLAGMDQFAAADTLFPAAMHCLDGQNVAVAGMQWADTMQKMGRMQEALNLLSDLMARFPDMTDIRHVYAQTLGKAQKIPEAVQEYDALIALPFLSPSVRDQLQKERDALL